MSREDTRAIEGILEQLGQRRYRFITPTPATIARVNARRGNERASTLEDALGWSRPFAIDLLPPSLRDLFADADLLRPHGDGFLSAVRVSTLGPDLFVHSAYPTLSADSVFFGPDTYRFVAAIEAHLARSSRLIGRAVDIGCGAGPGGIAVATARPGCEVTMVDINPAALRYAMANATAAGATNARVAESDLLSGVEGSFDLIVSNPPYLNDALGRAYRHGGGALGEALSVRIVETALDRLAPGGELVLYTGVAIVRGDDPFIAAVAPMLEGRAVDWAYREIDPDVFGEELDSEAYGSADRIAAVELVVTRRG